MFGSSTVLRIFPTQQTHGFFFKWMCVKFFHRNGLEALHCEKSYSWRLAHKSISDQYQLCHHREGVCCYETRTPEIVQRKQKNKIKWDAIKQVQFGDYQLIVAFKIQYSRQSSSRSHFTNIAWWDIWQKVFVCKNEST